MLGLWNEAEPWGETEGTGPGTGHMLGPTTALGRLEDRHGSWQVMEVVLCVPSPVTELSLLGLSGCKAHLGSSGAAQRGFCGHYILGDLCLWQQALVSLLPWHPCGLSLSCGLAHFALLVFGIVLGTFQLSVGEEHMENE